MTFSVTMPALGESVTEGTVTRWLKKEGDHVAVDEPLLEVSTDKVDTEIPSPVAGVLQKIVVQVDSTVAVGAELAVIADSASGAAAPVQAAPVQSVPVVEKIATPTPTPTPPPAPAVVAPAPTQAATTSGSTIVSMPALGESVTEGTVTRWLKKVGDLINVDEPLLEVSTDKVDTEIPSPVSGTVLTIDVAIDSTVAVGARLASIGVSSGATQTAPTPALQPAPTPPAAAPKPVAPVVQAPVVQVPVQTAPVTPTPAPVVSSAGNEDSYVTPIVRKLAAEAGVNLATVKGTGVGGRIRKEDILAAAPRAASAPSAQVISNSQSIPASVTAAPRAPIAISPLRGTSVTMTRLRKVIADRMVESLKISAQLTTVIEVDVTKIDRLRKAAKENFEAREGVKLTYLPFFAVAVCEALKQHPVLNSIVEGDQITYHAAEHLGIAVDTERGLLVPVIKDAGDLNMGGIARKITDVAARTRENKITPDELGGGTFTITNTGSR
jgi:2-oxoglutarate dehydrogenase E2 component (dihydrolipoamide succinyltransferase)